MDERDRDELNNEGNYTSGAMDANGKPIEVGQKLINTGGGAAVDGNANTQGGDFAGRDHNRNQHSEQRVEIVVPNLGGRDPTIADLYNIVAYDRFTGEPGLVGKVNAIDKRLSAVETKVVVIDNRLIDIDKLIKVRNDENRNKIHLSLSQILILVLFLILIIAIVAPWLQHILAGGVVDGRIGFALFLRRYYRLFTVVYWWVYPMAIKA